LKALVTGAAGFIGSHVVRSLLREGHEVRALHLPGEDLRNLRDLPVERVAGDVTDLAAMRLATRDRDWVFHLAAVYKLWSRDPFRMHQVNVEGTRTVLRAAREQGVARVVHTSSIARFGGQGRGRRATERSEFRLGSTGDLYSRTKRDAHEVALAAAARGQDVVVVAPTGPLGPGDVGPTPTGKLLLAYARLPVVAVVDTVTNFADVRDIADGHVLAARRGVSGECYLLGHRDLSVRQLGTMMCEALGVRRRTLRVSRSAAGALAHAWAFAADRRLTRRAPLFTPASLAIADLGLAADCSKATRELGMPQSPIERALEDALAWFRGEGYLRS
jgi:dihydroflavonol-4-reductase